MISCHVLYLNTIHTQIIIPSLVCASVNVYTCTTGSYKFCDIEISGKLLNKLYAVCKNLICTKNMILSHAMNDLTKMCGYNMVRVNELRLIVHVCTRVVDIILKT